MANKKVTKKAVAKKAPAKRARKASVCEACRGTGLNPSRSELCPGCNGSPLSVK